MWYGWLYTRAGWMRVCSAASIGPCASALSRKNPAVRNTLLCLTQGGIPTYTPCDIPIIETRGRDLDK